MGLADRDYMKRDYRSTRNRSFRPVARRPKSCITQKYYNLKRWFFRRKHPYSKLRLDKLQTNLGMAIGLAILLLIVRSYSDIFDSITIWFLELGTIISIILSYFIMKNLYKVFVNLKCWFRGSTNGFKLISIVLLILLSWQIYQIPDGFSSSGSIFNEDYFNILSIKETTSKAIKEFFPEIKPVSKRTEEIERLIFDKTNAEREARGLHELTWDSSLANTSREHSVDMAQNDFFSHVNLKGEDPTDRARRHSFNVEKSIGGGAFMVGIGENIGEMPTGNIVGIGYVSHDPDSIATAQVQSWMESPGHRSNILDPQYDKLGVGVAYDGMCYISTQNFQ
jgi:uncharacterized protein YkwD